MASIASPETHQNIADFKYNPEIALPNRKKKPYRKITLWKVWTLAKFNTIYK